MWINGTVFVKKGIKYNIKIVTGDINNPRPATPEELAFIKFIHPELLEEKNNIKIDENFWILFITNNRIFMYNHNQKIFEEYSSFDEIKEKFITLESFLNYASYLGKKLVIPDGTEIIRNGKKVYCTKPIPEYIILYILEDALIVKELTGNGEYRLISRFNPEFSKYELDHEIDPAYSNKEQVFQDIVSQIYHNNREDKEERQR